MATKFDRIRGEVMSRVAEMLANENYDVLQTGSQELCLPIVSEDGDEGYLVLTFKVPKGSRDGDAYDGYAMAQEYELKTAERAEKAQKAQAKKQAKIARDEKMRAQKAKAKAEREQRGV